MAKLTVSRLFEASKLLETAAGQQLQELITYTSEAFEQIIRGFRNNFTFEDNFRAVVSEVALRNGIAQVVNTDGKQPRHVFTTRSVPSRFAVDSFTWQINSANLTEVTATFTGSPTADQQIAVTLIILF